MELEKIRIRNFRSYKDSKWISLSNNTVIVGENNAGKSNFLEALQTFLEPKARQRYYDEEYFTDRETSNDIVIEAVCSLPIQNLPDELANHAQNGRLHLCCVIEYGETKDYYIIDSDIGKSPDLGTIKKSPSIAKTTLNENLPKKLNFQDNRSADDAQKTSSNYIPGKLLNNAIPGPDSPRREDIENHLLEAEVSLNDPKNFQEIKELEECLERRMKEYGITGDISMEVEVPSIEDLLKDVTITVNDSIETELGNKGTGMNMVFLLSCLQELNKRWEDTEHVVFCLEEPENNLHPHTQRQLSSALERLNQVQAQYFLTTHSPNLIENTDLYNIIRVAKNDGYSQINQISHEILPPKEKERISIQMTTKHNEMFFSKAVLFCEGNSELECLPAFNALMNKFSERECLFNRIGVTLMPVDGKTAFPNYLKVSKGFDIPSVVLIDDDGDSEDNTVRRCQKLADKVIQLDGDLENEFFSVMTPEEYVNAMSRITDLDTTVADLEKGIRQSGDRSGVLSNDFAKQRDQKGNGHISKPLFAKYVSEELEENRIPDGIEQTLNEVVDMAYRQNSKLTHG